MSTKKRKKKKEQQHIDPIFKKVMMRFAKQHEVDLNTQVEISHLPRTIDVVLYLPTAEDIAKVEASSAFRRLSTHDQIEFKSKEDPLTLAGYYVIRGRTFLYLGENNLESQQMSVTIVCGGKPRTVLARAELNFESLGDGYYLREGHPDVMIIVINELPIEERNYNLLIFASEEKKFREFLRAILKEGKSEYLVYAYRVRPRVTKEELEMAGKVLSLSRDELQLVAEDIGKELLAFLKPEEVLAHYRPEERLAGLKAKEVLTHYQPKERLAGLAPEERLAGLKPAEIRRYLRQLELGQVSHGA